MENAGLGWSRLLDAAQLARIVLFDGEKLCGSGDGLFSCYDSLCHDDSNVEGPDSTRRNHTWDDEGL